MLIDGIHCPDMLPPALENLPVCGGGVRKVFIFKPYIVAFYTRERFSNIDDALSSAGPKCIRLEVLSDLVTGPLLTKGLRDGLDRTTAGTSSNLQSPIDRLFKTLEGWKIGKGDVAHILHTSSGSIQLFHGYDLQYEDAAPGLAEALFGIWFSRSFSEKQLQRQLLGRDS